MLTNPRTDNLSNKFTSGTFYCRVGKDLSALRPGTGNSQAHLSAFCSVATHSTSPWKEKCPGRHVSGSMGQPEDSMSYICSHPVTWPQNRPSVLKNELRMESGRWVVGFPTGIFLIRELFSEILSFTTIPSKTISRL